MASALAALTKLFTKIIEAIKLQLKKCTGKGAGAGKGAASGKGGARTRTAATAAAPKSGKKPTGKKSMV